MDRRKSASVPTKRKSQPYLFLSPSRSERDVGFYFLCCSQRLLLLLLWGFFGFFLRKNLAKKHMQLLSVKAAFLHVMPYTSLEGSKLSEHWRNRVQFPTPRVGKCFPLQCATHLSVFHHSAGECIQPCRAQDKAASSATCQVEALGAENPKTFSQRSDLTCHPCRAQHKTVQGSPSVLQLCWAHMCKPRHPPGSLMLPLCLQESSWCCTQQ